MGLTGDDEDSNDSDVNMAECGACRAVIPIDSSSCSECGVSFSGVADDDMGECGACGTLVPLDSKSCSQCGVHFVLDDLTTALSIWMKDEGLTITKLFGMVDADNDGSLTSEEVKGALLDRNLAFLGADELDRFLSQIDLNDDGVISFAELAAALSMPWTPPQETAVLEPESTDDDSEDEEADDDDSDDEESDDDDSEDEEADDDDSDDEESDDDSDDEEADDDDDSEDEEADDDDSEDEESDDDDDSDDEESDDDDDSEDEEADDDDDSEDEESDDDDDDDDSEDEESDDDGAEDEKAESDAKSEGPAEWQRFLMRNYENAFPILYTLGAIFVGIWLVNAMGILVSGVDGPIAYNGDQQFVEQTMNDEFELETTIINPGEIYDCRDDVQVGGCKNSLTPLAGENGASSMPAGFYWDGIMFMVLGLIGLGGIGYLQMQIKQMRDEHRRGKSESSDDEDESDDDDSEDDGDDSEDDDSEDDGDDSEDDDSEDDDSEDDDDDSEDDDDDSEDDDDDSEDDDDDSDGDEIDVGSWVGLTVDDVDYFGEIKEFDDDAETVTISTDDDGDITGKQDDMFLED